MSAQDETAQGDLRIPCNCGPDECIHPSRLLVSRTCKVKAQGSQDAAAEIAKLRSVSCGWDYAGLYQHYLDEKAAKDAAEAELARLTTALHESEAWRVTWANACDAMETAKEAAEAENRTLREQARQWSDPTPELEALRSAEQEILTLRAENVTLRAELEQAQSEVRDGHQRLNECVGWEATKDLPLYERISKKIEQLAHDKSEMEHTVKACGHEMNALGKHVQAAEERRLAAKDRVANLEAALATYAEGARQIAAEMREAVLNADRPYPIAIFHESVTGWAEAILALTRKNLSQPL